MNNLRISFVLELGLLEFSVHARPNLLAVVILPELGLSIGPLEIYCHFINY